MLQRPAEQHGAEILAYIEQRRVGCRECHDRDALCPCSARRNYRTWILGLCYGYCFGVELTIDNNIASYFSDQFGKGVVAAGNFGAIFGLFNIISRPSGDFSSFVHVIPSSADEQSYVAVRTETLSGRWRSDALRLHL